MFYGYGDFGYGFGGGGPTTPVPVNVTRPTLAGTWASGQTITATRGTYTNSPSSFTQRWLRNGVAIPGETGLTYVLPTDEYALITFEETAINAGGSTVATSLPGRTTATYPMTGANNTLLSSVPGWQAILGDDSFAYDGAGLLKKNVGSATFGLCVEGGQGMGFQSATMRVASAQANVHLLVMASDTVGYTGYALRKSAATTLRLMRYNGGAVTNLVATITITDTGAADFTLEATVNPNGLQVDIVVKKDGATISTFTDSTASRLTVGRMGVGYVAAAAVVGFIDSITTNATTPLGGTGVTAAKTVRMGRETPANNGSVPASSSLLGLQTNGTVGFWEFVRVSGDATAWPAYVGGSVTPAPIRALTGADASTTAVYDVIIDGVNQGSSKRLTISVQNIAETFPALTIASQADIGRLTKASLGGKIVEFMEGCGVNATLGNAFAGGTQNTFTFDGFTLHTGRFTITSQPGFAGQSVRGMVLSNSARVDVTNLLLEDQFDSALYDVTTQDTGDTFTRAGHGLINTNQVYLTAIAGTTGVVINQTYFVVNATTNTFQLSLTSGGAALALTGNGTATFCKTNHSNFQNRAVFTSTGNTDCTFGTITVGAGIAALNDPTRWPTGFVLTDSTNLATPQTFLTVDGVTARRVKDGIKGGNLEDCMIRNIAVSQYCSNANFIGGTKLLRFTLRDVAVSDGYFNPCDPADHPDALQIGSSGIQTNYLTILLYRIKIWMSNLINKVSQGPFMSDVAEYGGAPGAALTIPSHNLTGFVANDVTMREIMSADGTSVHFSLTLGTYLIERCTGVRPPALGVISGNITTSVPRCDILVEAVGGAQHLATVEVKDSAFHNLAGVNGNITLTNNFLFDTYRGSTLPASPSGGANETARLAFYSGILANPASDTAAIGIPVLNGPMKMPDGRYWGAMMPDGSWNDGRVY